jgi:hypothetical protein
MSRRKRLNIILPVVIILFFCAYAWHLYVRKEYDMTGSLQYRDLNETSGIAASSINADMYYVHNDSGDTSRFFAINSEGELLSIIYYKGDPKERLGVHDCEDIAVGPGPAYDKSYVYVGDIGDNYSVRDYITVYRIEEKRAWTKKHTAIAKAVPIHLRYPDGPKDAETLMIDPIGKLIYIVSKREDSVKVYTTPLLYKPDDTLMLTKRATLFFNGYKVFKWITAGDISKDGTQVLLKSYEKVYYWKRQGDEPVWQTMLRKPRELPYKMERQGEAIGFNPEGTGYYTTSEGVYAPIYYYKIH